MSVHLQREVEKLKQLLLSLSSLVESSLRKSIRSMQQRDAELAREVIEMDHQIDHLEIDVEEECLKILALYQPVAVDLRFIVAVLKINNDLERIGDLAGDIAEHVISLRSRPPVEINFDWNAMTEAVSLMVKRSLDALVNSDTDLAMLVCKSEDEVDAMYQHVSGVVEDAILRSSNNVPSFLDWWAISGYLENIADHAKKIAEDVIYSVDGDIIRHQSS